MSAPEGHSLSGSISFPQWMKNKMNTFDFEQGAFSPTEIDDSYLLYHFPLRQQQKEVMNNGNANTSLTEDKGQYKIDPSKYTLHCQKYLTDGNQCATAQRVVYPVQAKIKSSGIDDGFKGEAAKCGSSIISLANTIISNKETKVVRGFDIENQKEEADVGAVSQGFNPQLRRGSKSLPASPLTSPRDSPKGQRKMNKYFTAPFVESEKHQGSWILSNLLAQRENISHSCDLIPEEDSEDPNHQRDLQRTDSKSKRRFIPKPSELREMNFWSPTSM